MTFLGAFREIMTNENATKNKLMTPIIFKYSARLSVQFINHLVEGSLGRFITSLAKIKNIVKSTKTDPHFFTYKHTKSHNKYKNKVAEFYSIHRTFLNYCTEM